MMQVRWFLAGSACAAMLSAYGCSSDEEATPSDDAGASSSSSGGSSTSGGGTSSSSSSSGGSSSSSSSGGSSSSSGGSDSGTDAGLQTCTAITVAAYTFDESYSGDFAPALTAGGFNFVDIAFYDDADTAGTVTLGTGANASPATCTTCILAQSGSDPDEPRFLFATEGTFTITAVDRAAGTIDAAAANVKFVEVTPDPDTGEPVPVPNGACLTLTGDVVVAE